jgi:hypothetical protein
MLESCGKIIKQDLWNYNGLEALPDSDDAADPRSGGGLGGWHLTGARFESVTYRRF